MDGNGTKLPIRSKHGGDFDRRKGRAEEVEPLLHTVIQDHVIPYLRTADDEFASHTSNEPETISQSPPSPPSLSPLLPLSLPTNGGSHASLLSVLSPLLQYSINTSSPGFLDKLYSAPSPPGLVAELVLATLNTNLHVYAVSPALTLIERSTAAHLAALFGLTPENGCPRAGGISVQGGSASNMTSIVVARNTLYPRTKTEGNWAGAGGKELVLFTSAHGHYSIEKAAQACGFGSRSVVAVPVVPETGSMDVVVLERLIALAREQGKIPFYVNATAGTTVLGSFDPFPAIAAICRREKCWLHVDASWGGGFVFTPELRRTRLKGAELADSIAFNPHKMLQVPLTCSFLLGRDMRQFQQANEIASAGYLFHQGPEDGVAADDEITTSGQTIHPTHEDLSSNGQNDQSGNGRLDNDWSHPSDLATLTLQCGRRGDSLKLFLAWHYYGTSGFASQVESAYSVACHLAETVKRSEVLRLVKGQRGPEKTETPRIDCLQVCFWYTGPASRSIISTAAAAAAAAEDRKRLFADLTARIVSALRQYGYMIDYAPPTEADADEAWRGPFFRVVVNLRTTRETVERLIRRVEKLGAEMLEKKVEDVG